MIIYCNLIQFVLLLSRSFILADDRVRIFQIVEPIPDSKALEVIDFNSQSTLWYTSYMLEFTAPRELFESTSASGIYVDGVIDTNSTPQPTSD